MFGMDVAKAGPVLGNLALDGNPVCCFHKED